MTRWVLLGSPFLGPQVWTLVADVPGPAATVVPGRGDTAEEVLASLRDGLPAADDLVLVPHSNAGLYVAALAVEPRVVGVLFVDALIPDDAASTPVTAPALRDRLLGLSDEHGRLPSWTRWWPEEDLSDLFGSPGVRARIEAGQPRVAASYLSERVPTPRGWADLPCGYLAFGSAYAEEQARAEALGWPVRRLAGEHLHQVVDPEGVAGALHELWAASRPRRRD